jgi:hypothetical protein
MSAIIFATKQLEPGWVYDLDPFAEWNGEHDDLISNSGSGKRYPATGTSAYAEWNHHANHVLLLRIWLNHGGTISCNAPTN